MARRLMEAGCDTNMADKNGFHPLTAALRHMKQNDETLLSFIRDLLVGGVDPDMCNFWGKLPCSSLSNDSGGKPLNCC